MSKGRSLHRIELHHGTVAICEMCVNGRGGECHTPGCTFWMCDAPNESQAAALRWQIAGR